MIDDRKDGEMTSRERVLKTIRREPTDRTPIYVSVTPQVGSMLARYLGVTGAKPVSSFYSSRVSFAEVLTRLGNDLVGVAACTPDDFVLKSDADGSTVDEWGIRCKQVGFYNEMIEQPLAHAETVGDLDRFSFPDPEAPGRYDLAEEVIRAYGDTHAIFGDQECTMFEMAWYLVGLEKFLVDLVERKNYVFELLDRIMEVHVRQALRLVELGVDIVWTGDDVGNQQGMMIAPDLWREVLKPRLRSVFSRIKKCNPDVRIAYHSCGSILPIIPDLIEIGLDILNPLQPLAAGMDARFLQKRYGDHLVFFGGIDVQQLLPMGTPGAIKEAVKEQIRVLGKGGGYIVAPAHNIQPDTPLENILALYEAVREA